MTKQTRHRTKYRVRKDKLDYVMRLRERLYHTKEAFIRDSPDARKDAISQFFNGELVEAKKFLAICEKLGITDWESIVDFGDEQEADLEPTQPPSELPLEFQALISEKTRRFVGRKFVFTAIDDFLASQDRGYFTVVGEPGQGKSAILAKYSLLPNEGKEFVLHFNIREEGKNRADYFLQSICSQLIKRFALNVETPARAFENGTFFSQLLEQVSQQLTPNTKLLVLVDALDEVEESSQGRNANLLYLPKYLPSKVYFIVSRRPFTSDQKRLLAEAPQEILDLRTQRNFELGIEDIKEYIRLLLGDSEYGDKLNYWISQQDSLSEEEFIEKISGKSENNFIYVRYILPDIANGHYESLHIEELPKGLEEYYTYHWLRMGMVAASRSELKLKVIYILALLKVPISVNTIAKIVSCNQATIQEVLQEWEQFLKWAKNKELVNCCSIYHLSFTDFLYGKAKDLSKLNLEDFDDAIADYLDLELYGNGYHS